MTMRFDILTIFPNFFSGPLDHGILSRAIASGAVHVATHDLRDFTHDRHRTVDDRPFGGGEGMVLKPQPIFDCVESLGAMASSKRKKHDGNINNNLIDSSESDSDGLLTSVAPPIESKPTRDLTRQSVILLSAQGRPFTQATAHRLATLQRIVLICGRYEGVDERVAELLADEELSIGDYVLSGGELAAAVVLDATVRLLPGVLGHADSARYESFGLQMPTLPAIPIVILSGARNRGPRRACSLGWSSAQAKDLRLQNRLALPAPPTALAASSITPTTPAPPTSAARPSPRSWPTETTQPYAAGGARWPSPRPSATAPTSSPAPPSPPTTAPSSPPSDSLTLCPPECSPSPESLHSGLALMKSSFWRSQNLCRLHETRHSIQQQSSNKILSYDVPRYKIIP